ncbi:MAG: hypothetical protein ACLQUT_11565 [Thermoleophilia bacterium]
MASDCELRDLLRPRGRVTADELRRMPPSLTPTEAYPWTRLSRGAFYRALASGGVVSCRWGHSIRIPTQNFLRAMGVLDDDDRPSA